MHRLTGSWLQSQLEKGSRTDAIPAFSVADPCGLPTPCATSRGTHQGLRTSGGPSRPVAHGQEFGFYPKFTVKPLSALSREWHTPNYIFKRSEVVIKILANQIQ